MRIAVNMSGSREKTLKIFIALSFLGVIMGAVIVSASKNISYLYDMFFTNNIFKNDTKQLFFENFYKTFLPLLLILTVQFFSGFFAFGQVLAVFTAVYRGIVAGISAALTYIACGASGIFAVCFKILPISVLSAAAVVLGARETVRMSWCIAEFSFLRSNDTRCPDVKMYLIKFGVLGIFAAVISLLDSIINHLT